MFSSVTSSAPEGVNSYATGKMRSNTAAVRNHSKGLLRLLRISDMNLQNPKFTEQSARILLFLLSSHTLPPQILCDEDATLPKVFNNLGFFSVISQTPERSTCWRDTFVGSVPKSCKATCWESASTYSYCSVRLRSQSIAPAPCTRSLTQLDGSSAAQGSLPSAAPPPPSLFPEVGNILCIYFLDVD